MTMKAKDIRQFAWQSLSGKWGVCVLIFLIYDLIMGACSGLSMYVIGAVALLLVTGPLTLGTTKVSLQVVKGEKPEIATLFDGFKDFTRTVVLAITNELLIFAWSLLFVIPGIIKAYAYSMSYYVLLDNPNLTANEARKKSMELMSGNKWRLFCLQFSFIGWYLLSMLTFGILLFWVVPYMNVATAKFYVELLPEEEKIASVVGDGEVVDIDADVDAKFDDAGANDVEPFAGEENAKQDFDSSND